MSAYIRVFVLSNKLDNYPGSQCHREAGARRRMVCRRTPKTYQIAAKKGTPGRGEPRPLGVQPQREGAKRMEFEVYTDMQARAEDLRAAVRAAKTAQGKSNAAIAEETGVGKSNVDKLVAGNISNPGLVPVAAICKVLGLSIDQAMGLSCPPPDGEEAANLKAKLDAAEKRIASLEAQERLLKAGIAYRNDQIAETRNSWKRLAYGLCGLAIAAFGLLLGVLAAYLVADYNAPEQGFIRGGVLPVWMVAAVAATICIGLYIAHWAAKHRAKRKKFPAE